MSRRKSILEFNAKRTLPERFADDVSSFVGSWKFLIYQTIFIVLWVGLNSFFLLAPKFDPYPFIFLNLILALSTVYLTPLIMMSQNRQEQKDRIRAEHDYKINLKAELEIKLLSEKMDHLLIHQNKKLLEIQEVQTDYLEDLMKELKKKGQ